MNFNEYRKDIELQCKAKNACVEEYDKLISVKTEEEFWEILNENGSWCGSKLIKIPDELLNLITYDFWKYLYCRYVKDREELWSTITDDTYKYLYCKDVKDRIELRVK